MGELINRIPPQEHGEKGRFVNKLPDGITHKQSHYTQRLYENQDLISETIYVGSIEGTHVPKQIKSLPDGISKKQSHYTQRLYENRDLISETIQEAIK